MNLANIVGQEEVLARLKSFGDLYSPGGGVIEHILLLGDEGMGKRTIADAFAGEYSLLLHQSEDFEKRSDLTAVLTNLRERQAVMLTNIHRLRPTVLKLLCEAARERKIGIIIGHGHSARKHVLELRPFTLIGTAPRKSDCSQELLGLFPLSVTLQPYSQLQLIRIAHLIATRMSIAIDEETAALIAKNCQGRPRQLELLLQQLARAIEKQLIVEEDALKALSAFGLIVRVSEAAIHPPPAILELSGIDFERLIVVLLSRMGFRAEMTKTTGDGGIDVVAFLDRAIIGGKYLFQCKRYSSDTMMGAPTVRDFYGAVTADRAVKGVFITTSYFTPQAREFAERVGLELIDQERLRQLMSENGFEPSL